MNRVYIIMEDQLSKNFPFYTLLKSELIEPRDYQINITKGLLTKKNTLVVLPTGLGKTVIAVFAIASALYDGKRALILSPTKPLAEQHHLSITKLLNVDPQSIALLTGTITAAKRREAESTAKVIIATPQTVANDLKSDKLSLSDFGIVVFDECHRAVGRYAYTYIANECNIRAIPIVGLTASPGSDRKRIDSLIQSLNIKNIEVRVSSDPDVAPYVMGKNIHTVYVQKSPGMETILTKLRPLIERHLSNLYSKGLSPFRNFETMPKGRLLEIGNNISKISAPNYKFAALHSYVYVLNLVHAYDMLATEGIQPFLDYFASLESREKKSRAVQSILKEPSITESLSLARELLKRGEEHPKMEKVADIIKESYLNRSVIVFAQYRSTIKALEAALGRYGINARAFVGKGEGVTQDGQRMTIDSFRKGEFRVLLATSIGEEGLDIPTVDCVIFYEPVPSAIRNIQRRGRSGRIRFGEVTILVTIGTKDQAYLMVSQMREKRMRELLEKVKAGLEAKAHNTEDEGFQARL
jgi:Fanconi anemia group M protein